MGAAELRKGPGGRGAEWMPRNCDLRWEAEAPGSRWGGRAGAASAREPRASGVCLTAGTVWRSRDVREAPECSSGFVEPSRFHRHPSSPRLCVPGVSLAQGGVTGVWPELPIAVFNRARESYVPRVPGGVDTLNVKGSLPCLGIAAFL